MNGIREGIMKIREQEAINHTNKICTRFEKRIKQLYKDLIEVLDNDTELYDTDRLYYLSRLDIELTEYLENVEVI